MKLIAKALVLISFVLLGSSAGAVGTVSPKWICGASSPVIAGAQVDTRTFIPGWGSYVNSPVLAGGVAPGTPVHELVNEGVGACQRLPAGVGDMRS
jgi:hypothetical protein